MTPLLLAVPLALAAPVPKDFKQEAAGVIGTWRIVWYDTGNGPVFRKQMATWTISGEECRVQTEGRDNGTSKVTIDATAKPKTIVFDHGTYRLAAHFVVDGDILRLCLSTTNTMPNEFAAGKGKYLYRFERVK